MKLIAIKPMGRLRPGDPFEVNRTQARALTALGRAKEADPEPERDVLRAQAEAAGVNVDGRWGEARLKEEIAAAETPAVMPAPVSDGAVPRYGRYRRRDMVSEE